MDVKLAKKIVAKMVDKQKNRRKEQNIYDEVYSQGMAALNAQDLAETVAIYGKGVCSINSNGDAKILLPSGFEATGPVNPVDEVVERFLSELNSCIVLAGGIDNKDKWRKMPMEEVLRLCLPNDIEISVNLKGWPKKQTGSAT